jgi:phosphoglycerol transferase MdoB-like AlkP superfamily enzyme
MKTKSLVIAPAIISAVLLFTGIPSGLSYGYYIFLRWVACICAIYIAYKAMEIEKTSWTWVFGIIALLFNPIFRFHMSKEMWSVIDFITAIIFIVSIFFIRQKKE